MHVPMQCTKISHAEPLKPDACQISWAELMRFLGEPEGYQ